MSFSNSPSLVLELGRPWLRVLPAAVLLLTALTSPWLASAAPFRSRVLCAVLALSLAAWAIWRSAMGLVVAHPVVVSWEQDQQWRMQFGSGESINATLSGRSWLSPWCMCLKFTTETGTRYRLMWWRGDLSPAAWQQWQLRLRLEAGQKLERRVGGMIT